MRTIVEARYEGIFSLLDNVRAGGSFPRAFDEHVPSTVYRFPDTPGRHEFKGQAFIPHMIYQDSQGRRIRSRRDEPMTRSYFVDQVQRALTQDNMTILDHTDVISGRRIPNERFERIAMMILESKRDSDRKKERLPAVYPPGVSMDDIVTSYLPPVEQPPGGIGTKATLTSALAVGIWKAFAFTDFYKRELNMAANGDDPRFTEYYDMMRASQKEIKSDRGRLLANAQIVVAHASPYMPDGVSGLTRILGFRGNKDKQNRFGEFDTLSFERASQRVMRTLGNHDRIPEENVWAYHVPRGGGRRVPIFAVHRHYERTDPGKRPVKASYSLLDPREFGLEPEEVRGRAQEKLGLRHEIKVPR